MSDARFVVMGAAGAGKTLVGTRLAATLGIPFIDGDDYHPPANVAKMAAGIPLGDDDRAGWLRVLADRLADARARNEGLVVACSALKRAYRDVLRTGDPDVRFIYLVAAKPLLAKRVARRRSHFMPAALVDSQLATLEPPDPDEHAWSWEAGLPARTILTGILARMEGAP
ncbi:MAG: gluconokinase [Gemmatimonadaceae bacterium]|nr:gluconokinase [Gemmatimonadaceae bacterium]NUQ93829.1 gluconokinase [Gemmatimonadaceae bacterium]NUR19217.1 gluconokinase [Gemmatimonadaceae bacterium]NUS96497.1 gluconokinase [Gemmatimonadaceae bacterium]